MSTVSILVGLVVLVTLIFAFIIYYADKTIAKVSGYWVGPDGSTIYRLTAVDTALRFYQNAGFTVRGNGAVMDGQLGRLPGSRKFTVRDGRGEVVYKGDVDWDLRGFRSPSGDWIKQGV